MKDTRHQGGHEALESPPRWTRRTRRARCPGPNRSSVSPVVESSALWWRGFLMRFSKAHAYGNDFLYVRAEAVKGRELDRLARQLCDRHTGVGADGLIVYEPAADGALGAVAALGPA